MSYLQERAMEIAWERLPTTEREALLEEARGSLGWMQCEDCGGNLQCMPGGGCGADFDCPRCYPEGFKP